MRTDVLARVGVACALALALAGCGSGGTTAGPEPDDAAPTATGSATPSGGITGLPVPIDLQHAFTEVLDARATAVMQHDRTSFLAGIDQHDAAFLTTQEAYYANVVQLPFEAFSYRVLPASLQRVGKDYWVVVDVTEQLAGFDQVPVTTPDRVRFTPSGKRGHFVLSSTVDPAWLAANHVDPQPWEREVVTVRQRPGVLGVFDAATLPRAPQVMASVAQGIADVSLQVPYPWSQSVVVYALGDDAFLDGLGDLPGDDPATLDGVAFDVRSSSTSSTIASTRVVLSPAVIDAPALSRDRLVRHELTHVAVGTHDDHAPVWLREGLAEWVSVQPMARSQQHVAASAVTAAEQPGLTLPSDADFNDADASAHYALAWWVCEYLAATYGPSAPWTLLDAFAQPGVKQADATQQVFALTPTQLARRGAKLMIEQYDPSYYPSTTPPATPPVPGATPTAPASTGMPTTGPP